MIFFWIVLAFILVSLLVHIGITLYASHRVYSAILVRHNAEQWGRAVSCDEPLHLKMDEIGMQWHSEYLPNKKDVHVVSNGLNLYGEYYDLGSDKCMIFLSGRTESLRYGYYFARPYTDMGMNVLVVDPRAHGLSDGRYNTTGFEESRDALAWVRLIHDEFGINNIILHGVCIGGAGSIYAATYDDCPDYIRGIVVEGVFSRFCETMKCQLRQRNRLFFPIVQFIDLWMRKYTGHTMYKGPIDVIGKLKLPILFIHSKMDLSSPIANAEKMFGICPSENKKFVTYEKGGHSLLRITDTEKYDEAVKAFVSQL